MKRLHLLLTGLSLVLIALSLNRMTSLFLGYLPPFEFLRWVDFNAMLILPLVTLVVYFFIKQDIETSSKVKKSQWNTWLSLLFVAAAFIWGVSSGDHETTNYLHHRFCDVQEAGARLCNIITYHDDTFSHYLYYLGTILLTLVLLAAEHVMPRKHKMGQKDVARVLVNAGIIALAVFGNLAFEPAGIDIVAFGLMAGLSVASLLNKKHHFRAYPVTFYLAAAYGIGLLATVIYKLF
jgi:hypothetical protein